MKLKLIMVSLLIISLSLFGYVKVSNKQNTTLTPPSPSTMNAIVTSEKALAIVSNLPDVIEYQKRVPDSRVAFEEFSNLDVDAKSWNIHVFEELPDHRATFNWYKVDKITGVVIDRITELTGQAIN